MTRRESDYVILREHESEVTFFDVLSFRAWMKSILSFTLIFPFLFVFFFFPSQVLDGISFSNERNDNVCNVYNVTS